ncbi:hypothetical protein SKAU_G00048730 [Synaphobranchus kaupii]|uniref:Uncharacterized protein n=1 Tax=Synaphobranchus kaupii TaxID=118154 RepID=A0A9Q1G3E4_SYNKA|nr:hypothetical protein SKAU_G00048730 [Synaphobranchus kaupii]
MEVLGEMVMPTRAPRDTRQKLISCKAGADPGPLHPASRQLPPETNLVYANVQELNRARSRRIAGRAADSRRILGRAARSSAILAAWRFERGETCRRD